MLVTSPLFGYLAKSSSSSRPQDGDTVVQVPGTIMPTLEVPFPFFQFFNAPLGAGVNKPVNSFIYQQEYLYNAAVGLAILELGPGLWHLKVWHDKIRAGAINDLTSSNRVDLIDVNTGATVTLTKILNDVATTEQFTRDMWLLVPTDQRFSINRASVAGLGTGTCLANLKVIGIRYF